ncbi:branched-chain amino acid ABC transporter permease [uncultured Hydrogenophaga sp.]|uniref:branched-chain amino acid ABC transporter permease n=1 Tax=uncultured Hydrogenophaga sp. TaxID=199683 RepID=UPI00258DD213|nr:branched-chain amino acid ABC transporter permease [uncultured Hydrogenophaga sp.]
MSALWDQVVGGLATGSVYGSLALALVLIHRSTGHINFAQGEMAMLCAYVAWFALQAGWSWPMALLLALGSAFVLGVLVYAAVIHRMRHAKPLSLVIVFIGLYIVFHSTAGLLFGHDIRTVPSPFPPQWAIVGWVSSHQLGMLLVNAFLVLALWVLFRHTRAGLALRAVSQNPASSAMVGINATLVLALGWGMAAVVGGVAGVMVAPVSFLDPAMMGGVLIYALAAALAGGIDSPLGAVMCGLMLGVVENLAGAYVLGTDLKLVVALMVIVGVLVLRPQGLLGVAKVERV